MALPLDKLGTTHGPATAVIDADPARARTAATLGSQAPDATRGVAVVEHGPAEVV